MAQKRRYKRPRTVHRESRTLRCRFKPRRRNPRTFNARSAARVVCGAITNGVPKLAIDREVQRQCRVAAPACDCERALLTFRQVLTISATVTATFAILVVLAEVIPLIVRRLGPLGLLLGAAARRLLRDTTVARLADESSAIEGVFFRVREEVIFLEREIARSTGRL